jgi:hypothetical protein
MLPVVLFSNQSSTQEFIHKKLYSDVSIVQYKSDIDCNAGVADTSNENYTTCSSNFSYIITFVMLSVLVHVSP